MTENAVAKEIVDVAYRLHTALGPGLFESVYEVILARELEKRGLRVATQQPIPVVYEGTRFKMGSRADLVVEDKVIVGDQVRRGGRCCAQEAASELPAARR